MHEENSQDIQPASSVLLEYLRILQRRKVTVLLCLTGAMVLAILVNHFSTPVYEAEATIIYEEPKDTMFALGGGQVFINKSALMNLIQQLWSRTLAREVTNALPPEFVHTKYSLRVDMVQGSDILKIKVRANDPAAAKVMANTYVERISDWNVRKKRGEIASVRDFVEKQLEVFEDKLNAAGDSLRNFSEKNQMAALSETSTEILNRLAAAETNYDQAKAERAALEQRQRSIRRKKNEIAPSLTIASSPLAEQLKQQLLGLEMQYSSYQVKGLSKDQTEMRLLKQKIDQVKQDLLQELSKTAQQENLGDPLSQIRNLLQESITLEVDLETYKAREEALKQIVTGYETELRMLPNQELQLARLLRARDVNEKLYSMLLEKREEARITEAAKIGDVRVIDAAEQPNYPIAPNKRQNLGLGFVLGLAIGVGLAFFLESLDTSLKSQEEVEKYMTLPVLAAIPAIHTNGVLSFKNKNSMKSYSDKLLFHFQGNSPVFEAFRTFQLNFAFLNTDHLLKSILLTSACSGDGKTLTALNLAQAFAKTGVRTLLLDCDLRRPMVHKVLGINSEPGLTNVLIDTVEPEQAVHKLENDNCFVMPCGVIPPNPSEILDSRKMRDLLAELKSEYDLLILDSPPLIAVTDSLVLSNEVDGVCLVIRSGRTSRDAVLKAKRLLEKSRTRIIGTILNDIDLKEVYGYDKNYYFYYTDHKQEKQNKRIEVG